MKWIGLDWIGLLVLRKSDIKQIDAYGKEWNAMDAIYRQRNEQYFGIASCRVGRPTKRQ